MKQLANRAAWLLITSLILTNAQCKKDNEDDNKSKTELLTSGQWHVIAHTSDPAIDWNSDGVDETELYSVYEACEKDDYITFNTDGTYTNNEGATKCDPDDPQTDTGTWVFTDNETRITYDGGGGGTALIEELTSTRLRLSINLLGYTNTITLSH